MKVLNSSRKKLKKLLSGLERSVGPFAKVSVALLFLTSFFLVGLYISKEKSDITASTVMITDMNGRSGGSGVIVSNSSNSSQVLTNAHVCQVASKGGLVKTTAGTIHTILNYRESETHDLCLITVASDLKNRVVVAKSAPKVYERATVSGHPALLPNVITEGHFSGSKVINVFMGVRKCTKEEDRDPEIGLICWFFRGFPIIRTFEAVLVTATIMPGSSGSAVYNESKQLGGLVFAGSGDIGYAFVVPYEYVSNFLYKEVHELSFKKPDYLSGLLNARSRRNNDRKTLLSRCKNSIGEITNTRNREKVERFCSLIERDSKWREIQ
jgi:S1-C subfamily serine protease